jgi:hypothetical protein
MKMALISADNNVVAAIIAKSDLKSGALAAPAVGGLMEQSTELCKGDACGYHPPLGV